MSGIRISSKGTPGSGRVYLPDGSELPGVVSATIEITPEGATATLKVCVRAVEVQLPESAVRTEVVRDTGVRDEDPVA